MEELSFFEHRDFKDILIAEFEKRRASHKKYSLRAFARDLNLHASTLSEVLNGKYVFSPSTARKVASHLKFAKQKQDFFCDLILSQYGRSEVERETASRRLQSYQNAPNVHQLHFTDLKIFSKWYYIATLELAGLRQGDIDGKSVARALGIDRSAAEDALTFLCEQKALSFDGKKYYRSYEYFWAESSTPNSSIRSFHKQILDLASKAIEKQPIPKRKSRSTIFSFDSNRIEEARKAIEKFHNDFFSEFEAKDDADSLYAISLQFFQVDEGT